MSSAALGSAMSLFLWPPRVCLQNYTSLAQVYSLLNLVVKVSRDPSFFVCEWHDLPRHCLRGG
jgi:hypothetical protein